MVAVFAVLGTLSMQAMKQMGVGLAVAVLIDATVIRAVLLPAVMTLLGERKWYLPTWLRWLPGLSHGGSLPPVGAAVHGPGTTTGPAEPERARHRRVGVRHHRRHPAVHRPPPARRPPAAGRDRAPRRAGPGPRAS